MLSVQLWSYMVGYIYIPFFPVKECIRTTSPPENVSIQHIKVNLMLKNQLRILHQSCQCLGLLPLWWGGSKLHHKFWCTHSWNHTPLLHLSVINCSTHNIMRSVVAYFLFLSKQWKDLFKVTLATMFSFLHCQTLLQSQPLSDTNYMEVLIWWRDHGQYFVWGKLHATAIAEWSLLQQITGYMHSLACSHRFWQKRHFFPWQQISYPI